MFSKVTLGNADTGRTEVEISDDSGTTIAVLYENQVGFQIQILHSAGETLSDDFASFVQQAKEDLAHYVNRRGENPPEGLTKDAFSLWLLEKDDGTCLGMPKTSFY